MTYTRAWPKTPDMFTTQYSTTGHHKTHCSTNVQHWYEHSSDQGQIVNHKRQALDAARKGHEHRHGTSGQVETVGDRQHAAMIAQLEGWVGRQLSAASRKTTMTGFSISRRTWVKSTKNMIVKLWEMDAEAGTVDGMGCPRQDGDADGLSSSFIGVASDTPQRVKSNRRLVMFFIGWRGGRRQIETTTMSRTFFPNDLWSGRVRKNIVEQVTIRRKPNRCIEMCHTSPQTNNTWMRNLLEQPWRRKDGQRKRRRRLVFALEGTLERLLADWVADGLKASSISCSMNCVCFACEHCGCERR